MAFKLNWGDFAVAIVVGVIVGVVVGVGGRMAGLPGSWVPPLVGGISGGLIPVIYRMRMK